jgi:hypothetical protein
MAELAGLLQALPRGFAYGLKALIEKQGGVAPDEEPAVEGEVSEPEQLDEAPAVEGEVSEPEQLDEAPAVEAEVSEPEQPDEAPAVEAEATESAIADADQEQEN